jgi:putative heme degradation protein
LPLDCFWLALDGRLVSLAGSGELDGRQEAVGALASLAADKPDNQRRISTLLTQQLSNARLVDDRRAKAAWAVSKFAATHRSNQDVLAQVGGVSLLVKLLEPVHYDSANSPQLKVGGGKQLALGPDLHSRTQMELCAAIWSVTTDHPKNRRAIADAGGIPLLIAMLEDHPDIHFQASTVNGL